ncbi:preferentially expressed antigen in melanoma-like protein 7 [Phodopus roborovskii]|uniref:Gm13128 protein n=1 Tax=Phodopus roborovskii TaxID=109678 RepID=A0AAV0ABT2_PHORO|nr:preferentially expressed antigen in melanoma-like protein 7 [Phodopus roborovskii]CAH7443429.1 Gm13128 [Phodopus roborovskii]
MSFQDPLTLLQLAVQSLIRNESLSNSSLQDLPIHLFPPLFKEANTQRKSDLIKVLVAEWPYPCLPVGMLMNNPTLETYQAMLDGVDTWLRRKYCPRGQKLQVVDLRNVHVWKGHSPSTLKHRLEVVTELQLPQDEHQTQLLQWVEKRQASLQVCCVKLKIGTVAFHKVRSVLKMLQPQFIEELELNTVWSLSTLAKFVPYIRKMRNLHKMLLIRLFQGRTAINTEEQHVTKIISLFSDLSCLQHLTIKDVYFLHGHMKQLLRCLKTPLECLTISLCKFSQSDLDSFAQWSQSGLKHLYLRGLILTNVDFMPLEIFLESVAHTLQALKIKDCGMKDADLRGLLPVLSQCTQLTTINFVDNDFSIDALKDLLYHTANLSQLTKELYPAPKEVYDEFGYIQVEEFSQCCDELRNTLVSIRQFKSLCFKSTACYDCGKRYVHELETTLCECST